MGRKALRNSRGSYKIALLVVGLIAVLGVVLFVVAPRLSKPSWEQIRQMMIQTDPAEDSGRLALTDGDRKQMQLASFQNNGELADVGGTGVSGKISAGFESGKYSFYGEFQRLPALSPGQSYQVWLVRDKPFEYIPAVTIIVTDSASYQVEPSDTSIGFIDWQEIATMAVADPASYMKWLRGESMDLAVRWAVAAETGPDGLGKTRAVTYYGSSTDLTGYDRVVLTQEEADGNIRPGKFILQGKINSSGSIKSNLQFPIIYTQKNGEALKGTEKCPAFEEESNLIFCGETESQVNESLSAWKAGRLAKPSKSQDDEVLSTVCGQECIGQFDRESDGYSSCYAQCVVRECLKSFMSGGNCPDVQEGNANDLPNGGEGPSSNGNSGGSYVVPR